MKNVKFIQISAMLVALLPASLLLAQDSNTNSIPLGRPHVSPCGQTDGIVKGFLSLFSNRTRAERLESIYGAQAYERLIQTYKLGLIQAFGEGTKANKDMYGRFLLKLMPYLSRSTPQDRDPEFISKFIEYYHPGTAAFEALEDWQLNTYKTVVAGKAYYDEHADAFEEPEDDGWQ